MLGISLAACSSQTTGGTASHSPLTSPATAKPVIPSPAAAGPRLERASLAYDAAMKATILFGTRYTALSQTASGAPPPAGSAIAETWKWLGGQWTKLTPPTSPPPRTSAGMAYDDATKSVVLFGGQDAIEHVAGQGLPPMNDTWTWNGETWRQEQPAHRPAPVVGPLVAYDAAIGKVVVVVDTPDGSQTQTWTWDGTDWVQLQPSTAPSPSRFNGGLTYDAAHRQVVLYGGVACSAPFQCSFDPDVWTFDGKNWTNHRAATGDPAARIGGALTFDTTDGRVLLYGGDKEFTFMGDSWTWDGARWSRVSGDTPSPRSGSLTADDGADGEVVLYGGEWNTQSIGMSYYDTWIFQNNRWTLVQPTTEAAPADDRQAMLTAGAGGPGLRRLCSQGSPPCMSLEGTPQLGLQAGYLVFSMNPADTNARCVSYVGQDQPFGAFHLAGVICGAAAGGLPVVGGQVTVHVRGCANVRDFPLQGPVAKCLPNGTVATIDDGPVGLYAPNETLWWHLSGIGWVQHDLLLPAAS